MEISVTEELKSDAVELCHLVTLPVFPLNVSAVLFVPEHTDVLEGEILPPAETGSTVIVAVELFAEEHEPLVTTAR